MIIIGDAGVGKTSCISRYISNEFTNAYKTTVGVDFLTVKFRIQDRSLTMQVWDTLTVPFYRGANIVLIAYAVNDRNSFDNLPKWYNQVKLHAGGEYDLYLVGMKIDEERCVTLEEGRDFASKNGLKGHFETSAKTGVGVTELFSRVACEQFARVVDADMKSGGSSGVGDLGTVTLSSSGTSSAHSSGKRKKGC
ncbi:vacuolar biogenesis protein [Pelomyxa schiedti]|nr:vacuolar biogenesis protein [Pelomyxa schiedti]